MKKLGCFRDFKVRPLDGGFDARSPSGELNFYDFRVVLNMDLTDQRKRCRMGGWQKFLSDAPFGFRNQDLHDQLFNCDAYYESITGTITYPRQLAGFTYPVWYPEQEIPDYYTDGAYYDGYTIPAYGAGDGLPIYAGPYSYEETYCGDYAYQRGYRCREAITLLYEAVSVGGRRKLLAGTKSRLYALSERSGNWRILLDGQGGEYQADDNCGCAARRFKAAQTGNIVVLTNNFDPPMTWEMDAGPGGCDLWSAEFVPELQALNITKAGVVAAWRGFTFLADIEEANERHGSRIYWSDYNDPRAWAPGGGTLAGSHDLGRGERVVAIAPIGGQLRVYTTRGDEKAIYDVTVIGDTEIILNFAEIYRGPDGIEYENSLVNTGATHIWVSTSGFMVLGEYDRTPQRLEWIYKADSIFYNGLPAEWLRDFDGLSGFGPINKDRCENVVGGFNSEKKQIWYSWPTDDNECANISLVLNPVYRTATLVDHGFTAFCVYRPDYTTTLRDFLAEFAGCQPEQLVVPKEGDPLMSETGEPPAYIRNYGEDPSLPPDPDSVCALLDGLTLEDLCEGCGVNAVFAMASASDRTIKEFVPDQYFRERYVDQGLNYECPSTIPGVYALDGYYSMLQSDAVDYGTKTNKLISKALVEFSAAAQTTPSKLFFNVAVGAQPSCLTWDRSAQPKLLECLTQKSRNQHKLRNTRPDDLPTFHFHRRGSHIAWRFYSKGTGGGAEYGGVTLSVRNPQADWR